MNVDNPIKPKGYLELSQRKDTGAHYTPTNLSDFVATQIIRVFENDNKSVDIADPAIGDGELLSTLASLLSEKLSLKITAHGFDIDHAAVESARKRMSEVMGVENKVIRQDFIDYVLEQTENNLFQSHNPILYDAVIANPPYVRTQVLGAKRSQLLSKQFKLKGRVDLYHAFILGISKLLKPGGVLGIIVSNRFMTTKSGEEIRKNILELFDIIHIWDFGDTQLFEAAVLPAVLLLKKKTDSLSIKYKSKFTSIYSVKNAMAQIDSNNLFDSLEDEGLVDIKNKGVFNIQQGFLDANGVWKISNHKVDEWMKAVDSHTKMTFSDVGKIRVGVKTTADKIFIRSEWGSKNRPELLRKLTTHHVAGRYKAKKNGYKYILYPHTTINGTRSSVDINEYPKSKEYLLRHKEVLENRDYLIKAGRQWYEIWVPQDPGLWSKPKIVFRDISEKPTFWLDQDATIVNGDCYWLVNNHENDELLWLVLAVANSSFIESFYDHKFNNKLYSGRRRFITQYVEKFPLPDPETKLSTEIILLAKKIYDLMPSEDAVGLENKVDQLVWKSFGFSEKEISR